MIHQSQILELMKKFSFLLFLIILSSCATSEVVLSEFDENADFDSYSTFVLCVDDLFVENVNHPNYDNNYVRELIGNSLEQEMIMRGHRTNVLNPELQVGFELIVQEKTAEFYNCEFNKEFSYWEEFTLETVEYTEETLVVYVSEFKKNQIIWQASKKCDLNRIKSRLPKLVNKLVHELFNEYPKLNEASL